MRPLLAALVAYVGSRAIFAASDFDYDVFGEPFSMGKLIIDAGVFVALYAGCHWLFGLKGMSKTKDAG